MNAKLLRAGIGLCFAAALFLNQSQVIPGTGVAIGADSKQEQNQDLATIKGKIINISQKAKTIALANQEQSFFLVKFTDDTNLKEMQSAQELGVDEAVIVEYQKAGAENIAVTIQKAVVKLPEGLTEIKTDELAKMIAEGKDLVLVDSRPKIKYDEFHIPGAVSIPYAKLTKMGEEGATLLEQYKGRQLVFYCGGFT